MPAQPKPLTLDLARCTPHPSCGVCSRATSTPTALPPLALRPHAHTPFAAANGIHGHVCMRVCVQAPMVLLLPTLKEQDKLATVTWDMTVCVGEGGGRWGGRWRVEGGDMF